MIAFNTPKLAKNNTSNTLDFSNTNLQLNKEIDLLLTDESPITVTPDAGYLGMQKVTINHPPVEELTETEITQNGEFHITPSEGYDATMGVTASVQVTGKPKTLDITKNGTYTVTGDDQPLSKVTINAKVAEPSAIWTDAAGMKYSGSTVTKFPDGLKFAPRTEDDCRSMFSGCIYLTEIPLFDISGATSISNMFASTKIVEIPAFDTSNVTRINNAFGSCTQLETIAKLNFSQATTTLGAFVHCTALVNLGGFTGLKENLSLSDSTNLTKESLLNVINEAADVTANPKTLTFGATNLAKLTDEEKAIATNKGWTLA